MEPKPKPKIPLIEPFPSKEKFLELADQLENGEIAGIELNKEDLAIVTAVLLQL